MRSTLRQHRLMPMSCTSGIEVFKPLNMVTDIRGLISCYLEIGVEYGMTLESVKAKNKISGDYNSRFHNGFQIFNLSLHQMNSEAAYVSRSNAVIPNDFKWHGDVYSFIYSLIGDFPKLNYVTITDIGNPTINFYVFSKANRHVKNQKITEKKSNNHFLSDVHISIPDEFNLISRNEFFNKLKRCYESL
jgi:hypothetical protein